ncbi:MAG: FecCD family ABC transporter permease [Enterococcus sp.]|uniref:FecCD family ABC transporter permease n=1 Tax=Enterococcus sp. TaxID=35783 RepID=UPI00289BF786|nr:iron ABC transporter permease [Enterococcus sp.]
MKKFPWLLLLFSGCFIICFFLAITQGAADLSFETIRDAVFAFDYENQLHQVLRNIRLPRVLAAFLVGSCFAVTGAIMQGITRNPLADGGLLGVNSGAALGLAIAFILFPSVQPSQAALFSFFGAFAATGLLFLLTRYAKLGMSPTGLILAGVALSSFFSAISQTLSLQFDLNQELAFWFIGGAANVTWQQLRFVGPIYLIAIVFVLRLGKALNLLALGDDTVISLGKHPHLIRASALLLVVVLAGMAVSLVGPVSFFGLMVPHVVRGMVGKNYQLILPLTIIGGGTLVMAADLAGRLINPPFETPFGILMALIGVPFLLVKIRRED